jgi:hypothetical protein
MACGCGRSPTGKCIGWHALTEDQYQQKRVEWENRKDWERIEAQKKAARKAMNERSK